MKSISSFVSGAPDPGTSSNTPAPRHPAGTGDLGPGSTPYPAPRRSFGILGVLEISDRAGPVVLTAHKPRTLLSMLLLHAGQLVGWCRLTEELWGTRPPRSATANLRTYAAGLRHTVFGGGRQLVADPEGFRLHLDAAEDAVDLAEFDRLCTRAGELHRRGDLRATEAAYQCALRLWRGPPLAGLRHGPALAAAAVALSERRAGVVEDLFDVHLDLGGASSRCASELAAELRRHVADHPLRERPLRQLIVALYRLGDVAGALDACAAAKRVCRERLGLDPDARIDRLECAILGRDPDLSRPGVQHLPGNRAVPAQPRPAVRVRSGTPAQPTTLAQPVASPVRPAALAQSVGSPVRPVVPVPAGAFQVAVCGPRRHGDRERLLAEQLGRLLARRRAVLLCGAGSGAAMAAATGARAEGGAVVGVGLNPADVANHCTAVIAMPPGTSSTEALVRSADVMITVGGSWATVSEIAAAMRHRDVPVVMLAGWRIADAEGRPIPGVREATTPQQAVDLALRRGARRPAGGRCIPAVWALE